MRPARLLRTAAPLACLAALAAHPVRAQDAQAGDATAETHVQDDDFHTDRGIVVTAPYVRDLSILGGTSELSGDDLSRDARAQIGDALTRLPGVSATSFTPGASRPILRGFQGERIRVLVNGIGTIDVSNTSPDHGVAVEPVILDRVEVLRGPAVLLFGGQAVGGAVNAIDKRIPGAVPESPFHLDAIANYASATNERSIGSSLDVPLAGRLVAHVDGSYRNTDDLEVGGFVLTPELRAQQRAAAADARAIGDLDAAAQADTFASLRGRIPNTATETYNLGGGLSFVDDGGVLGVSVGYLNSDYGVPTRPGGGEAEPVRIALDQVKVDLKAEAHLPGFFETLRARAAYADFRQTEFEGATPGTRFGNQGIEARAELVQREHGGWRGASGVQYVHRDFTAVGEEAFVPANLTDQVGLFTLQEVRLGRFELEGAARYDHVDVSAATLGLDRSFDAYSFALGLAFNPDARWRVGVNLNRAERAPSAEELFANGPHLGTQAFEIGNPDFTTEKSWGGEAYIRYDSAAIDLSLTGYYNDFSDFVIDVPTGDNEDGLPVFQFIQADARYYGFEFEGHARLAEIGAFRIGAEAVADYTRAQLDGIGPVPRIPPLRLLGGLNAESDRVDLKAELEWTAEQNRIASFETPTDSFALVNASATWRPFGREGRLTLIASADNIFDVVGRRAASFTKDFAPLPGRDLRLTARVSF